MDSREQESGARPDAEGVQHRGRGRLTVRGVLEILAERLLEEEVRADPAEVADEDLRAVLAFESEDLVVRGVVR